mmetsp:Transcript_20441/g.64375  ORF Transcript_20441/g.64375 Transcript_20441/m.64375 type:complete len:458 (+) Transcript_20441:1389-2762(+)
MPPVRTKNATSVGSHSRATVGTAKRRGTFRLVFFPVALSLCMVVLTLECQSCRPSCKDTAHPHLSQHLLESLPLPSPVPSRRTILQTEPSTPSPEPSGLTVTGSAEATVPDLHGSEVPLRISTRSPTAYCSATPDTSSWLLLLLSPSAPLRQRTYERSVRTQVGHALQARHFPRGVPHKSELSKGPSEFKVTGRWKSGTDTTVLRSCRSTLVAWFPGATPRLCFSASRVSTLKRLKPAPRRRSFNCPSSSNSASAPALPMPSRASLRCTARTSCWVHPGRASWRTSFSNLARNASACGGIAPTDPTHKRSAARACCMASSPAGLTAPSKPPPAESELPVIACLMLECLTAPDISCRPLSGIPATPSWVLWKFPITVSASKALRTAGKLSGTGCSAGELLMASVLAASSSFGPPCQPLPLPGVTSSSSTTWPANGASRGGDRTSRSHGSWHEVSIASL